MYHMDSTYTYCTFMHRRPPRALATVRRSLCASSSLRLRRLPLPLPGRIHSARLVAGAVLPPTAAHALAAARCAAPSRSSRQQQRQQQQQQQRDDEEDLPTEADGRKLSLSERSASGYAGVAKNASGA